MIRYLLLLPSGFWLAKFPTCGTRDIEEALRLSQQDALLMASRCPGSVPYKIEDVGSSYAIEDLRNSPLYRANAADSL